MQAALFEFNADFLGDIFRASHFRRHCPTQERNSRARAFSEPWAMQLMMLGGGAKVPQDRLVVLRKQREAAHLVLSPRADVRRREVSHIVHVEAKKRAHFGFRKQ